MAGQNSLEQVFKTEISLHKSDFEYGKPLDLGEYSIAFHASDCPRCAYLTLQTIIHSEPEYSQATFQRESRAIELAKS